MMAHKLRKGTGSLLMAASSSLRVRPVAPTIMQPQDRRNIDERVCGCQSSWWSPFHSRRLGLNGVVNVGNYQREYVGFVPATSSPRSCRWQGGRGSPNGPTTFSNIPYLSPESCHWEEVQGLEQDCLQGNCVSTANLGLINRKRQEGQEPVHLPFFIPLIPTTPSPLIDRPHRGTMPRSGYDTTHMLVAVNPRPAASAGGTGNLRNDKPRGDGNNNGSDGGSGSGVGSRGEGNGRDDDDNGSQKATVQEPRRENEDGEPTTEKPIEDVRIPMEGRGWTFWL
ncbi:hypothetical protein F5883DRAFT_160852 [Diaporthe sp. PMI_573]|nr:hypothetical protein F5883DRAFT_160852 [Diaporthaceae sp. PMI_573]